MQEYNSRTRTDDGWYPRGWSNGRIRAKGGDSRKKKRWVFSIGIWRSMQSDS